MKIIRHRVCAHSLYFEKVCLSVLGIPGSKLSCRCDAFPSMTVDTAVMYATVLTDLSLYTSTLH